MNTAPDAAEVECIPEPSGDRYVYFVPSSRNKRVKYRVDLVADGGFGRCTCPDFSCRRAPNIAAGCPMGSREVLCRHLIAVRKYFLNAMLKALAAKEENAP